MHLLGDGGQRQLFHIVLVQIQLQPLGVGLLGSEDHPFQADVGGQGLQRLGVGLDFLLRALAEQEEGVLQGVRAVGPPVQQSAGVRPLLLDGGVVQVAAHSQIGERVFAVIEGHDCLADAQVAAVKLKAALRRVAADLPHVAVNAALVPLGQVVYGPAKGRMPPK